jgi:predicted transcriptional regulator of viral defense system
MSLSVTGAIILRRVMSVLPRSIPAEDGALLHAAAQRGKSFLRLPEDEEWLAAGAQGGSTMPIERRLQAMVRRGSLVSVGKQRWVVLPPGASTIEQAAPLKTLLAAKFEGRVDWYLGYLSALADHGLTDIEPEDVYVGVRGRRMPTEQRLGTRRLFVVQHTREDDWRGIERERAGRAFTYRSDVERTLLDTLDQPRRSGPPEVWVRAWERAMREQRADPVRLTDYAEQCSDAVQARLAFWLRETGHVRQARRVTRALGAPLTGRILLDASRAYGEGPWRRDRETGLVANLPERAIDGWLEYGK